MKKQINPTIKAHLIRSAFYVLLLVAVCVIPFALAQRNSSLRAVKRASNKVSALGTSVLPYDAPMHSRPSSIRQAGQPAAQPRSKTTGGTQFSRAPRSGMSKQPRKILMQPSGTICGLLVGSGMTLGFEPNGWNPTLAGNTVSYTFSNSQPAANEFALFDTHDPWGFTTIKDAITAAGHTYTEFTPADLAGFDFSQYQVVILNWDDTFTPDFVADYTAAIPALETYVNAGGVVWVQSAIQGCDSPVPMPFGGQGDGCDFSASDPVVDTASPMMVGMPNPIPGNSASHLSYTSLAGGAHVVVISGNNSNPTLYDFRPGKNCGGPTPTPTPACTPAVFEGTIDGSDPTQTDRLFRDGVLSTCDAPKVCPGAFGDGLQHHYDQYTLTNTTGSTQCVSVDASTNCVGTNYIFLTAYLGSFDPSDICANYLADQGSSPDPSAPPGPFSFNVDDGQTVVIVVSEVTADAGCPDYIVTVSGLCGGGGGCVPEPWQEVAAMTTDLYGAAGASDGTNFYAAGGYSFSQGITLDILQKYDGTSWTTLSPMPQAQIEGCGVYYPVNNRFYVFGGEDAVSGTNYNLTQIYDIASDTWTMGANMPDVHSFAACGFVPATGKIYILSGYNTGQVTDAQPNTWEYDPVADTWTDLTGTVPFPHPAGGFAYGVINDKVYVAGGRDAANTVINNTWEFDPTVPAYTAKTDEPGTFQNNVPGSAAAQNLLWVFGGGNPFVGGAAEAKAGIAAPSSAHIVEAKRSFPLELVKGLFGHKSNAPDTDSSGRFYDPSTDTWTASPNMNEMRSFSTGGAITNSLIIAAGGYDGVSTVSSAETEEVCGGATPTPTPVVTPTPTPGTPTPTPPERPPTPRPRPTPFPRPTP